MAILFYFETIHNITMRNGKHQAHKQKTDFHRKDQHHVKNRYSHRRTIVRRLKILT